MYYVPCHNHDGGEVGNEESVAESDEPVFVSQNVPNVRCVVRHCLKDTTQCHCSNRLVNFSGQFLQRLVLLDYLKAVEVCSSLKNIVLVYVCTYYVTSVYLLSGETQIGLLSEPKCCDLLK